VESSRLDLIWVVDEFEADPSIGVDSRSRVRVRVRVRVKLKLKLRVRPV